MATYQKRGYKKSVDVEEEGVIVENDGTIENSTTAEVFNTLDETANKSEKWIENNSKALFIGLIAVVAIIFGYMGYTQFIEAPKQKEAADALVFAKQEFTKAYNSEDNTLFKTALEGADGNYGLLDIADNYGGTNAGNLAKYYAGISYLKLEEFDKAVEFLGDVKVKDEVLNTVITGSIGDAYWAKGNKEKALNYFSNAAATANNQSVTPVYLLKAGKVALELKDFGKAEEFFTELKESYPTANAAKDIEKFIHQAKYAN